jgi:ribose 5-phosphate isomerase B
MKISIGADHGGVSLRSALATALQQEGHTVIDHGTFSSESVDYPDFSSQVGADIIEQRAERGILICKTGIGMSIAANKISGVRAALVHFEDEASLCRQHNNANVIVFGSAHTSPEQAVQLTKIFLATEFEGGRHQRRVDKMESPHCC